MWYHTGSQELEEARYWLAEYSIPRSVRPSDQLLHVMCRARDRLKEARLSLANPDPNASNQRMKLLSDLQVQLWGRFPLNHSQDFGVYCSEVGDTRPLTACQFSPDGQMLATGSLSGLVKLWSIPDCKPLKTLKGHHVLIGLPLMPCSGHMHHVGACVWHPESTKSLERSAANLASCGADGRVQLWSLEG